MSSDRFVTGTAGGLIHCRETFCRLVSSNGVVDLGGFDDFDRISSVKARIESTEFGASMTVGE
jgi:hypothetical protein